MKSKMIIPFAVFTLALTVCPGSKTEAGKYRSNENTNAYYESHDSYENLSKSERKALKNKRKAEKEKRKAKKKALKLKEKVNNPSYYYAYSREEALKRVYTQIERDNLVVSITANEDYGTVTVELNPSVKSLNPDTQYHIAQSIGNRVKSATDNKMYVNSLVILQTEGKVRASNEINYRVRNLKNNTVETDETANNPEQSGNDENSEVSENPEVTEEPAVSEEPEANTGGSNVVLERIFLQMQNDRLIDSISANADYSTITVAINPYVKTLRSEKQYHIAQSIGNRVKSAVDNKAFVNSSVVLTVNGEVRAVNDNFSRVRTLK